MLVDQRVRDLEQQIRLLRIQLSEVSQQRATGIDRTSRELFETVGTFFHRLAEAPVSDPGAALTADLRALLEDITSRHRPLSLATPVSPVATICIDGSAPIEALHGCLAALQAAAIDRMADIIVLDDGTVEEVALLPTLVRNLNYLRMPPGQSLTVGRNEAAMTARGSFFIFLSPDARPAEGWMQVIRETFAREERAAAVGSSVLREDGSPHPCGLLLGAGGRILDAQGSDDPALPNGGFMREVDALGDFAFAVRGTDFIRAGGFDLGFGSAGAATFDLCMRLRRDGRTVLLQPSANVHLSARGGLDDSRIICDLALPDEDSRRLRARWVAGPGEGGMPVRSSRTVGHALVIDTLIPRPDEDAGSIATASQMMILRQLGYRVTFAASASEPPASSRAEDLRRQGVEFVAPPHYKSVTEYLDEHGGDIDLVMVYRHENMRVLLDRIRSLAPNARTVFVPCDLHFLREERRQSVLGEVNERLIEELRSVELSCIAQSDATIVPSDHEMALLRPDVAADKVRLLRWITAVHPPVKPFSERAGLCFVAGFSHKPNQDGLMWFVQSILPEILARDPSIQLHIVGSNMPEQIRALVSPNIVVHGWVKSLEPIFERVRVSIAPLRYGAGFKGKVATSLSHGVPVVGTRVSFEGTGLKSSEGILAADAPAAFASAVLQVHDNEALWTKMSFQAIERCETLYSKSAAEEVFRSLLLDLDLPVRPLDGDAGA